jgi:hypothetical protein
MPFYAGVRSFLIASHEAAVTRDISRDDCSQTTWQSIRRQGSIFAAANWIDLTARMLGVTHGSTPLDLTVLQP